MRAGLPAVLLCVAGCWAQTPAGDGDAAASESGAASVSDAGSRDAGTPGGATTDAGRRDAGPPDLSTLPACEARRALAGACAMILEGSGGFGNEGPPLSGTIVAMGPDEARPDCFGSDNWGRVIPNSTPEGQEPIVPEGTQWWRVDDGEGSVWTIAVAAPGLSDLGVTVGDRVSFKNGVGYSGYVWHHGNAEVSIQDRGRVEFAISDSSMLRVLGEGPAECARAGMCAGYEWAMRVEIEGEEIAVPPGKSVTVGTSLLTNALAFTHAPGYNPDAGNDSCGGPKIVFVASLVTPF